MRMEFSIGIGRSEKAADIPAYAQLAEECGYSHITLVDMQNISRDVYVMMTQAALSTHRIQIGHGVTVPTTRHPSVTANATATISELTGGRVILGIGAGGNAFLTMGQKPRPIQELRETVQFFKKYMAGEEADYQGAKMHSEWVRNPVPIYMSADHPKSLELAGELADGVIMLGSNPVFLQWKIDLVKKGAQKAGRDFSKIDIWARTMVYPCEDREQAKREVSGYPRSYGVIAPLLEKDSPESNDLRLRLDKAYPGMAEELIQDSSRFSKFYDPYQHEKLDSPHSKVVTQTLIDFVHFVGTPDQICERVVEVAKVGVTNISTVNFTIVDKAGMMKRVSEEVMNHFRN